MPLPVRNTPNQIYYRQVLHHLSSTARKKSADFGHKEKSPLSYQFMIKSYARQPVVWCRKFSR